MKEIVQSEPTYLVLNWQHDYLTNNRLVTEDGSRSVMNCEYTDCRGNDYDKEIFNISNVYLALLL